MRASVTVSVAKRTRRGVCHKDFFRIGAEGKVRAIMAFLIKQRRIIAIWTNY